MYTYEIMEMQQRKNGFVIYVLKNLTKIVHYHGIINVNINVLMLQRKITGHLS